MKNQFGAPSLGSAGGKINEYHFPTAVLVGINVLQLPAVDNSKYTIDNGQIIRMNTREGTFERCDADLKCVEVAQDK
jgi:hypothetical protein